VIGSLGNNGIVLARRSTIFELSRGLMEDLVQEHCCRDSNPCLRADHFDIIEHRTITSAGRPLTSPFEKGGDCMASVSSQARRACLPKAEGRRGKREGRFRRRVRSLTGPIQPHRLTSPIGDRLPASNGWNEAGGDSRKARQEMWHGHRLQTDGS